MLKLILGRSGTGKTTAVLNRLTEAGQRRKPVSYTHLTLPTILLV